jgi:hypothetical protein
VENTFQHKQIMKSFEFLRSWMELYREIRLSSKRSKRTCLPEFSGAAGAAFLLRTPARKSILLKHQEGVVSVRKGAAYATVAFDNPLDLHSVRADSWRVIQESFDSYAETHRVALLTRHGEREYLFWIRTSDGYHLTCVYTLDSSDPSSELKSVRTLVTTTPVVSVNITEQWLRFYRLSLASDDLFDAYRNAYLCLENLASAKCPRFKDSNGKLENENAWLIRGLSILLPSHSKSYITEFVEDIYKEGRNRIFHAKFNETFYAPHGDEQEHMQKRFERLSKMLFDLIKQAGSSNANLGIGYSQSLEDAMNMVYFQFDELIFRNKFRLSFTKPMITVFDKHRRFGQIWARVTSITKPDFRFIDSIIATRDGKPRWWFSFEESVPLTQVSKISLELNTLSSSGRASTPLHLS